MDLSRRGIEGAIIGLLFAFFALADCQCDSRPTLAVAFLLGWPLVILAVVTARRIWPAAAYLLAFGVLHRLGILLGFRGMMGPAGVASDVLSVTWEAVGVLVKGGNPYTHAFANSDPAGIAVFAYPPGNLLYYLPGFLLAGERMRVTEIVSAGLVLAGLAWAIRLTRSDLPVALMGLYAAAPPLIVLSTDNSNDTSAGALIFMAAFALLLARRRMSPRLLVVAGLLMGWALGFKHYALVYWPFFVAYLAAQPWRIERRGGSIPAWWFYLASTLAFIAIVSVPFIVWSPSGFFRSMLIGPFNPMHGVGGWNVWGLVEAWPGWRIGVELGPRVALINLAAIALAIAAGLRVGVSRPVYALTFGVLAWFVAMFTAKWTTYAYFAGVAPVALLIPLADRLVSAEPGGRPADA